jgi:hypothetical protein
MFVIQCSRFLSLSLSCYNDDGSSISIKQTREGERKRMEKEEEIAGDVMFLLVYIYKGYCLTFSFHQ